MPEKIVRLMNGKPKNVVREELQLKNKLKVTNYKGQFKSLIVLSIIGANFKLTLLDLLMKCKKSLIWSSCLTNRFLIVSI